MTRGRPTIHGLLGLAVLLLVARAEGAASETAATPRFETATAKISVIVDDLPQAGAIAVKPTGQACLVIDRANGAIEMVDPSEPTRRHRAVAPFPEGERPVAIACVDSITAAVVTHAGRAWTLKTYRLAAPGTAVDPAAAMQSIPLGEADADGDATVGMAVSPSRNWIAIAGLPSPIPPVMRGAIAGARISGMSTRNCPRPEDQASPANGGVAISPAEELVLFERPETGPPTDRLAMYSTVGTTRLLSLDCGLPRVRAAAYARDSLWVLAGNPADEEAPEGLWRLDASIRDRRQVIRPVCVARFASPVAVAALSNGRLLVVHGDGRRTVSLVEPGAAGP